MNSHQLRFFLAVVDSGFSVTRASRSLHTSQPGVSKQLRLLEEEVNAPLFQRKGKALVGLTPFGETVVRQARSALGHIDNIRVAAADFRDPQTGTLSIATTHTQARYALPDMVGKFRAEFPRVTLHIHQGTPAQISSMISQGEVDFGIATEGFEFYKDLILLPWYRWNRCLIVPSRHPLLRRKPVLLRDLANHPLITYTFGFTGRSQLDAAFGKEGLTPNVVVTAVDADVIKAYVKLGLGVGIIARMAYERTEDRGLSTIHADHLFEESVTRIGFRPDIHMSGFKFAFLRLLAPHFTRALVEKSFSSPPAKASLLVKQDALPLR